MSTRGIVALGSLCIIIILGAVWLFFAITSTPNNGYGDSPTTAGAVSTWHDDTNKVTCWIFAGYYKGGIHCIPDWQLTKPE